MRFIEIRKGYDFHCHLKTGRVLNSVVNFTAQQFKGAVVMPDTAPPILNAQNVSRYRREITDITSFFEPLMTIQINEETTPDMIEEAKKAGAIAGGVYPQNGVTGFGAIYPAIERMQKLGMLLLLHGEDSWEKTTCLDRERVFLPTLFEIASDFPKLKIVLEHITTEAEVDLVESLPDNVAATITPHHLFLTIDDVDRTALLKAAFSGNPKFFFGSNSNPAEVFNAPIALPLLAQIFEEHSVLNKLENFAINFGIIFYNLHDEHTEAVILAKEDLIVPPQYNGIVPSMAGETLHWKIGYAYQQVGT